MSLSIALIGGGPSALFVYQELTAHPGVSVQIFERGPRLGVGMPYGPAGAGPEHSTNISSNEMPDLPQSLSDWLGAPEEQVVPRLRFGDYLEAQFQTLLQKGLDTTVHLETVVHDVIPRGEQFAVVTDAGEVVVDRVVICSGHKWPTKHEGRAPGWYDSPYPPTKLPSGCNHPVALRGASLTAMDAMRTLARRHGEFLREGYAVNADVPDFKLVLHARNALLPCVRFFLEDPQFRAVRLLTPEQQARICEENDGFIPLDLLYREYFVELVREKEPALGEQLAQVTLEEFVDKAMTPREENEPFAFLEAEYNEALVSLHCEQSVTWKEALAAFGFAVNYPAKHFSAEDTLRLRKVMLPLVSIIIACLPRDSAEELLALHAAGCLELLEVGHDSSVEPHPEGGAFYRFDGQEVHYQTYVDCVGQPSLELEDFPFPSLRPLLSQATVRYRDPSRGRLELPGAAITDDYRPISRAGVAHPHLHLMAVPYMGGHNPDYSGLDFCEEAASRIVESLVRGERAGLAESA